MMERWIETLKQELDLTAEEIADFAWLTVIRQRLEGESITGQRIEREDSCEVEEVAIQETRGESDRRSRSTSSTPPPTNQDGVGLFPQSPQPVTQDAADLGAVKLKVDSPPSIRNPLEIVRALRAIAQRLPTGQMAELDEVATVQKIAEERIWDAIATPVLEPWLEVAIVVDESASMLIWRKTVLELQKILNHYGSFRDVRVWGLIEKDGSVGVRSNIWRSVEESVIRSGQELVDPNGRRLILLVTDCVAQMWQDGTVLPILKQLSEKQPLVMLQMFPEWLWTRTGLRHGEAVRFSGREAGVPNHRLKMKRRSIWEQLDERKELGIRVPVVTLEPERLRVWSQMVAGGSGETPGFLFQPEWFASSEDGDEPESNLTAKQRVQQFRVSTSPLVRRLAGLLAATPVITLPVVRLVQETLLKKSQQVHVAEVLLGGILQPVRKLEAGENPEQVEYRFVDEQVQNLLLGMATVPETVSVLSQYIAKQFGKSLDEFVAELRTWTLSDDRGLVEKARPFAIVTAEVLRRKGGKYAEFVQQMDAVYFPAVTPVVDTPIAEPELSSFGFEIATIEETNEEELITFEFATLEIRQTGSLRREKEFVIKRHLGEAWCFRETLNPSVTLEMIEIPGGKFLMGSPEDEKQRSSSESPQHEVTIAPFYMGKYAVTQAQWKAVAQLPQINRELDPDPSRFKGKNRPVERVSWYEAVEFCDRLSAHSGKQYRLPTEAEWEYACRAGTTTPFHYGETITTDLANYNGQHIYGVGKKGENREQTTDVGSFPPNVFGLYDLHGNVWEWCLDHWHENYEGAPVDGRAWVISNESKEMPLRGGSRRSYIHEARGDADGRLLRGGSWGNYPAVCRSAVRDFYFSPDVRNGHIGFRVVFVASRTS